jgi:hypothetical protein
MWVDTQIDVAVNDRVDIRATGTIKHNGAEGNAVGPDGDTDPAPQIYNQKTAAGADRPGNHAGLIGKVGFDGDVFIVGSQKTFAAPRAGRLYLGINDNGVDNNSGHFDVNLSVSRP